MALSQIQELDTFDTRLDFYLSLAELFSARDKFLYAISIDQLLKGKLFAQMPIFSKITKYVIRNLANINPI